MVFPVIVSEGLVFSEASALWVENDGLAERLPFEEFEGRDVLAVVSHVPVRPLPGEWGLGSCHLRPVGVCPFGHHETPHRLLVWKANGTVVRSGVWWTVGGVELPPSAHLIGHRCKVIFCPKTFDVNVSSDDVEAQISALSEALGRLKRAR